MKKVIVTAYRPDLWVSDKFKIYTDPEKFPKSAWAWICNPSANHTIGIKELKKYPRLKYLVTPSTGKNHIDETACKMRNVEIISLLDDRAGLSEIRASSEFTLYIILNALRQGGWRMFGRYLRDDDVMRGNELYGKLVGFVGYGRIGRNVANWVKSMGANYDWYDPKYNPDYNLSNIFKYSDIVVICCELNSSTAGLVTKKYLDMMKEGAILVNTARAEIINETDLHQWCDSGGRYATDVLHGEVTGRHVLSPLLKLHNVYIHPHIAGTTYESQEKAANIVLKLLEEKI